MRGSGLLVHVGYHKTGSTWLGERLFTSPPFERPVVRRDPVRDFIVCNPFLFDVHALQDKYSTAVGATIAAGAVPVLSYERLSGSPHSGGYDSRAIADRLAAVLPDARILIVIRRQHEMLPSVYKQYVKMGGLMSCRRYITPPRRGTQRIPLFRLDYFEYDNLIAYYQRVFSPSAILVLPYEQLLAEPTEFCAAIGRHVGADLSPISAEERVNVSSSALSIALKRRANRLLVRDTLNPGAIVESSKVAKAVALSTTRIAELSPSAWRSRAERKLRDTVGSAVRGQYAESNARTARLTGLDLSRWGYEVAPG